MGTFDPKTGVFHLDPDDPREIAMVEAAQAYVEDGMRDPCTCAVHPGPHVHAPGAYAVYDSELQSFVWLGG